MKRLADRQKREREHRLTASLFRLHKYAVERDKPFESFANIPLRKEYSDAEIGAAYAALEADDIVEKVGTADVGGATGRKSRYRVTEKGKGTADMLAELPADPASPPASQEEESKLDGW